MLKPWNQETFNEIIRLYESGERKAAINQATGTGKSSIIKAVIDYFNQIDISKPKLIIVPLKDIGFQFEEYDLHENTEIITYSRMASDFKNKKEDIYKDKYSLIVADELHRTGASKWGDCFKALVDLNPNAKILGATATPLRKEWTNGLNKRNMIDELFDGNSVGNINLPEAISKKILPPYDYHMSLINIKQDYEKRLEKIEKSNTSEERKQFVRDIISNKSLNWKESEGINTSIKNAFSKLSGLSTAKIIVFCSNIAYIDDIEDKVIKGFSSLSNNVKSYKYHNKTNRKEYEEFKETKDGFNILFVVNKLNEGVHLSDLDGAIFLRPTESSIVYFQQLGRLLSFSNNRRPIILDLVNNISSIIKIQEFVSDINKDIKEYDVSGDREGHVDNVSLVFSNMLIDSIKELKEIDEMIKEYIEESYEWNGRFLTADEIAEEINEPKSVVLSKLRKGLTVEETISLLKGMKDDRYLFEGRHYTLEEFSKKFKIKQSIVSVMFQREGSIQNVYNKLKLAGRIK